MYWLCDELSTYRTDISIFAEVILVGRFNNALTVHLRVHKDIGWANQHESELDIDEDEEQEQYVLIIGSIADCLNCLLYLCHSIE
jgi:hypothetical protein